MGWMAPLQHLGAKVLVGQKSAADSAASAPAMLRKLHSPHQMSDAVQRRSRVKLYLAGE